MLPKSGSLEAEGSTLLKSKGSLLASVLP